MKLTLLVIFISFFSFSFSQNVSKTFGGTQNDKGEALYECANNDILIGGITTSFGSGGEDVQISRLTPAGTIIWSKAYGLTGDEQVYPIGIIETNNGDILCSFRTTSLSQGRTGVIMRLNSLGDIIWQKQIGSLTGNWEWTRGVIEQDDGTIYVASSVDNQTFGAADGMITKLNASGTIIWSKVIGVASNDHIWGLIPLPNGEILLNMNSQQLGPGLRSSILVKMDAGGNILSQTSFGGAGTDAISDMIYVPNLGYLIAGGTNSYGQGGYDAFVAKFDLNFNLDWFKTYGGNNLDYGSTIEYVNDNHFIVYMNSDLSGSSRKQASLIGVDSIGTTIYTKHLGDNFGITTNPSSSKALIYSQNQNKTFLTNSYYKSNNTYDMFFLAIDGPPNNYCNDSIISESFHTPTVTPVTFSIDSLGSVSNMSMITTPITNLIVDDVCPCPFTSPFLVDTTICPGTPLQYNLDASLNYQWLPASAFSCSTCPDPLFTAGVTTQVTVIIDNNSCYDTLNFTITTDIINPTGTAPADITVQCISDVPTADITLITNEADNCTAIPTVTHTGDASDGNTCPEVITRTYNITDDAGNSIDVTQVITIHDDTNPTGTAPPNEVFQCTTDIPAPDVNLITDEADNCTSNPFVTFVADVSDGNTCPETITRTYNIADTCGNNIDVTQIFTIHDDIDPTGSAPAAITIQCITDLPAADIALITDEADNCTVNPTVTHVSDVSNGNTCPEVITRTYTIADDCGNDINVTQTITINDDILPTGTIQDLTFQCIGDVPPVDVNLITDEADNCTTNPLVTFVSESSDGNTCPEVISRIYNIADDCGNNINITQTITINDDTNPTGNAPADLTVQCIGDLPVADITLITDEADNCTVNPTVTFVGDVSDGNTCPEVITRTYNIEDDCGNNIDVVQTITINDDTNPTGTAPADLALQCFVNIPAVDINSVTDEADNCTVNPIVTHVSDMSDGNTCPEVVTRTYNIADDCGNNINVIQTFTINDDINPTASNISSTVQCLTDVPVVDISVVSDEVDNCTINPTVAFVSESTDGDSCNGEIITRIYSITDDCGNSINVNHTILVDSYTPNFTVSGVGTTTCDGTDGTITLSGLSLNTNYEMSFDGGTTNPITTDAAGNYVITGLSAGSYTNYTVSDADCPACTTTENVSININDPTAAIINAGPDAQYCEGTTVILNAFNPENANITWNNGVTDGVGFIPPVGVNYYTVTSVRVNCYSSDQLMITVSPAITDITCPGDLIASCDISEQAAYADFEEFITAGGSATIPVGGVIDSASFSLFSEVSDGIICPETITRTYQISDTCGVTLSCTQQIVISEIINPTGTAPNDTLVQCIEGVPIVDVLSITDEADNCSTIPTVTHVSDISDGNTCPEIITRTYNIEDKCGNNIDVVQTITIDDDILPTASNPDTIFVDCLVDVPVTDIAVVTDEADNCTANPTVTFLSEATDANTCNGEQITRIYRITDDCGNFINVTQIIVIDLFDPVFTVSSTNPTTCDGNEGTITLSGLAPNFNYELIYDGGNPFSITTDAAGEYTITGLVQGAYTDFTVTEGTCLTCSTTENITMTLTDPLPPIVNAGTDIVTCENETITLTAFNPDAANISWNNGITDGVGFVPPVGITTYTVTAERVNCFTTDQVQVTINPLPIVSAGNDFTVCDGDQATLSGSGADTYVWDNGVIDNVPFTPSLGLLTYTVVGTSVFGCVNTDQIDVEVIISPDISFTANRTIGCAPQEINLFSTSPGIGNQCVYTINGVEQISGCNINHIFTEAGCFDVNLQVELTNGCTDDLTVTDYICIDDYPIADFTVNPEELTNIYNKTDFTNESSGATDYEWNFGDGNFSNAINPTHEYSVDEINRKFIFDVELVATSNLGCKDTFNLDLPFFEELIYFIPNTFTPDGNQYNESFKPVFTSGFDPFEYKLQIYNRWGELIFESNDPAYGWDGSYGSSQTIYAPDGVYLWKVYFKKLRDDENVEIVGSVNLLR
ncbi:HYR-like domain-containing protein [Brumimicrobium glaciale]|nr:gliding motility-associated C-terminal domain-containing protein [Brumimicrobium glaciale]